MPVTTYSPAPGTVPFRAIAWLEKQGAAFEARLGPWAEAIDVDPTGLNNALEAPIKHGLVVKFAKPGTTRPVFFKLPDGPPRPTRTPTVDDDDHAHLQPAPSHAEVLATARNGNGALPGAVVAELSKPAQRAIANGASIMAGQFDAPDARRPDGVDIDRVNRIAESILAERAPLKIPTFRSAAAAPRSAYQETPPRGLTAMQARGEVMESEACASATDRGGNAASARAAGPAPDDLRAARWLDDSLSIELDGVAMKLTRAQALRIVALYGVPA